jgi:hypothetical protein
VQKCCNEDHARSPSANATPGRRQIYRREQKGVVPRRRRRRGTAASSRAAVDTPKNVIVVLTGAGEPSGRKCSGGLLFYLVCAQETEREELRSNLKERRKVLCVITLA